ncbi:MAG: type II toxin-antitoxin system PemK/MazF family toxin [Phycisphaerales bacterium]|nr:type II toxin-antitoxin system PemK/MazF family toxin [Phycisphaerales bacterium]
MVKVNRGEIWLADLGFAAKVRPCLVLSVSPVSPERILATIVSHTTTTRQTQFEVAVDKPFLKPGAFDAQSIMTISLARTIRKLGELTTDEMTNVENAVKQWLGLA